MKARRRVRAAESMVAIGLALLYVACGTQIALGQGPVAPSPTATEAPPGCPGDCNRDGVVTVDELVTMAGIALGDAPSVACADGAGEDGRQIRIDAVIAAVNAAVSGCTGFLRPTPTPTASPVPFPTPPVCGNGRIEPPEQCDDNNVINGDGCDSHCRIEPYCHCDLEPSVCACFPEGCAPLNPLCSVVPATPTPTATPTVQMRGLTAR